MLSMYVMNIRSRMKKSVFVLLTQHIYFVFWWWCSYSMLLLLFLVIVAYTILGYFACFSFFSSFAWLFTLRFYAFFIHSMFLRSLLYGKWKKCFFDFLSLFLALCSFFAHIKQKNNQKIFFFSLNALHFLMQQYICCWILLICRVRFFPLFSLLFTISHSIVFVIFCFTHIFASFVFSHFYKIRFWNIFYAIHSYQPNTHAYDTFM